jgi:mercuric ion binding protein
MNRPLACLLATASITVAAFAAESRTVTLGVSKMDCAACPITVRKVLEKVPGVGSARVDFQTRRAVVVFDPAKTAPQALTKATTDAGFPSSVKQLQ